MHTKELLSGCDDQYPENEPIVQPENFRIPVGEMPPQKIYGKIDPIVGTSVEFFAKVLDSGQSPLYKNG